MARKTRATEATADDPDTTVRFTICLQHAGADPDDNPKYLEFTVPGKTENSDAEAKVCRYISLMPANRINLYARRSLYRSYCRVSSVPSESRQQS